MANFQALDRSLHQDLRLQRLAALQQAHQQMVLPMSLGEVAHMAREYVIVFLDKPGALPHVLISTNAGASPYLSDAGHWLGAYIPAYLRVQPFAIAALENGQGALMIDVDSPCVKSTTSGTEVFTSTGERSPLVEEIAKNLIALHHDEKKTQAAMAMLEKHGLLIEKSLEVKGGKSLTGIRIVNEDALQAMTGQALHELQQTGALKLAHAHLISLVNLRLGRLAQQNKSGNGMDLISDDDGLINFANLH